MPSSTIVALSTPRGEGAISIVRISGSDSFNIAKRLTKRLDLIPRYAHLATLYDVDGKEIDQAIVIYFKAPKSYTGEDLVEFQLHGGLIGAELLIKNIIACGAVVAKSGEFTIRAVHNNKMDLSQAEATVAMIGAKSERAASLLTRQIKGGLKSFVDEIRSKLVRASAHVEVAIDYAEDDIPVNILDGIIKDLISIEVLLNQTIKTSKARGSLLLGYKIAIIGKPNVGKSSLLNSLVNFDRAIVSDIAGTTRDTVEEQFYVGGVLVKLVDTAGIRSADDEVEKIGIERSKKAVNEADLIVAVFDGSSMADNEDEMIIDLIRTSDKECIVAINKSDLEQRLDLSVFDSYELVKISAKNDITTLLDGLEKRLSNDESSEENLLVTLRQIETVVATKNEVNNAHKTLLDNDLELFSYHCQEAIRWIQALTKPFDYDELLDVMFGEFCLGK